MGLNEQELCAKLDSIHASYRLVVHKPDDNTKTLFVKTADALKLVPAAVFGTFSRA